MMHQETKTKILTSVQVNQKLERIAHQIIENYFEEKEIVLVGIAKRGYLISEKLNQLLNSLTSIKITHLKIELHKDLPLENSIQLSQELSYLNGKTVILVDDVLNSGRTLIHATRYLIESDLKQLTTVVLVDRRHRKFPIKANFVGLTLSTTMQEHISVKFNKNEWEVYLE